MIESKSFKQVINSIEKEKTTDWTEFSTSASNASHTARRDNEADKTHYITMFEVVLRGGEAKNDTTIELKSGNDILWKTVIGAGAPRGERVGMIIQRPMKATGSAALYVAPAGSGCVTEACIGGFTL